MTGTTLPSLEAALRSTVFLDREIAGRTLADSGSGGARVLASVVADVAAAPEARVTALRHLPAGEEIDHALRVALNDALPVIRVLALKKVTEAHATGLRTLVEPLTRDPASFWDLDEEISVAAVAAHTLASLAL